MTPEWPLVGAGVSTTGLTGSSIPPRIATSAIGFGSMRLALKWPSEPTTNAPSTNPSSAAATR
jgi:hypothetical protein